MDKSKKLRLTSASVVLLVRRVLAACMRRGNYVSGKKCRKQSNANLMLSSRNGWCSLKKRNALYLSVNVFITKVPIENTSLTSPTGDGAAILRAHSSHAKVYRLRAVSLFSVVRRAKRETRKWPRAWLVVISHVSRLRRSCARALPLLNRKKKRDCSQSRRSSIWRSGYWSGSRGSRPRPPV